MIINPHYILQKEVCKDISDFVLTNTDFSYTVFSTSEPDWKDNLRRTYSRSLRTKGIFCSIDVMKFIHQVDLAHLLWIPHNHLNMGIMNWNWYSTIMPNHILNSNTIMLPFGKISENKNLIKNTYGNNIFLKPNSPWKPFTGFSTTIDELDYELNAISQIEKVMNQELVIITDVKEFEPIEYRCWCIEGEVATSAPYSWQNITANVATPSEVLELAKYASDVILGNYINNIVIDIGITPNGPKIIELNSISTSGWYTGMDINALLAAITRNCL